ncbi:hypothetical protein ACFLW0_02050 [Chloroflexota bacterium]
MMKKGVVVISALVVALAGVITWGILTLNQLNETRDTLSSTQAQLATTTTELNETEDTLAETEETLAETEETLAETEDELTSTENELANTSSELASTQNQLASTKSELTSTRSELASTRTDLSSTESELASIEQQLDIALETLSGLDITLSASSDCWDVTLIDNPEATNPTWSELMTFIKQDLTDRNTYIDYVYDCSQFSRDVHNNAEAAGIRAAEVQIYFRNQDTGHALNAFITTDYGLVYIDCTESPDTVARVKSGRRYRGVTLIRASRTNIRNDSWWDSLTSYYYIRADTGGEAVTSDITIFW